MYYPIIRTRTSELVAFENLPSIVQLGITPIFELTRARRTVKDKEGSIEKNIERILKITNGEKFIIDFTTDKELDNTQIASFSDKTDGFKNWCDFCINLKKKNGKVVPCLALLGDSQDSDLDKEIKNLSDYFEEIAIRIPLDTESNIINDNMFSLLEQIIRKHIIYKRKFIFIFDFSLIKPRCSTDSICSYAIPALSKFIKTLSLEKNEHVIAASSFPRSVTEYSEVSIGQFPIKEMVLFFKIYRDLNYLHLNYGDYASIHPIMYSSFGGNWVPRIDISYGDKYFFFRFKRDEKGYIRAGESAKYFMAKNSILASNWGLKEIEKAASGKPSKNNPSFWISVRVNIHIYNVLNILRNM